MTDPEAPPPLTGATRPKAVTVAVFMVFGAETIRFVLYLLGWAGGPDLATYYCAYVVAIVLAVLVGTGRNWARIAFAVSLAAAALVNVEPAYKIAASNPLAVAREAAFFLVELTAVILLFRRSANSWYKAKRPT